MNMGKAKKFCQINAIYPVKYSLINSLSVYSLATKSTSIRRQAENSLIDYYLFVTFDLFLCLF